MRATFRPVTLILAFALAAQAAGPVLAARTPRPLTAQAVVKSFFKGYGNRYDESPFHKNVSRVEIGGIEEINYRTVYTDAVVNLNDGRAARVLAKMERHFPVGWKVVSWELLDLH